ncbi:unnamed protein product [Adineta steineri]|uniref:Uncharacterized protein n=2 Tax=Adineta steineri TaxID=433720 RepID=A0A814J8T8_9BILA|nr:unnamed protein product [Adineta steineri]
MFNHLFIIFLSYHLLYSTTCLIIHTQRTKYNEEICVKNHFRSISTNNLHVCYINNNQDHSILIWFKIDNILFNLFHFYRFILRTIDDISLTTNNIHILTNFTELIDLNNSLRVFNLNSGQYEICLDFQSNLTTYIYSPRNGCISIRIGKLLHRSFKQSSIQLFIALITGIILFLLLGLIVQWLKSKQIDNKHENNKIKLSSKEENIEQQTKNSNILSTVSLKKQRDRIVKKLFRSHIDQQDSSSMKQWARNRAFRHRIATQEQEIHSWNKPSTISQKPNSPLTTNDIYIIPMNECSRKKISLYLKPSEEFELL